MEEIDFSNLELSESESERKKQEFYDRERLNTILNRIEQRRELEKEKKQKRRKVFKVAATVVLSISILTAGYGKIKELSDKSKVNPNNIRYEQVENCMCYHAHYGEPDDKGHVHNAYDKHNCVAPNDGVTEYTDRLANALEGQYSDEVIDETIKLFNQLAYDESKEKRDEAYEKLEKIEGSLYINEDDGLWYSTVLEQENSLKK